MKVEPGRLARVVLKDAICVALFLFIAKWQIVGEVHLTTQGAPFAAAIYLAFYALFQFASGVKTYRDSYRETLENTRLAAGREKGLKFSHEEESALGRSALLLCGVCAEHFR